MVECNSSFVEVVQNVTFYPREATVLAAICASIFSVVGVVGKFVIIFTMFLFVFNGLDPALLRVRWFCQCQVLESILCLKHKRILQKVWKWTWSYIKPFSDKFDYIDLGNRKYLSGQRIPVFDCLQHKTFIMHLMLLIKNVNWLRMNPVSGRLMAM